jgi:hypothetical protein
MTTTVVIAIDDDGMLGNIGSEEIEQIDIEETYSKYLEAFTREINLTYPEVEVETKIGPTTYGTKIYSDDLTITEIDEMEENIREIGSRIYENGTFWTVKTCQE